MRGKAQTLRKLSLAGFPVPPFFVVEPKEVLDEESLKRRCEKLANPLGPASFAVRSSAQSEDGASASYAGMFETFLFVKSDDVADRIRRVRNSVTNERVRAYDKARGSLSVRSPSVIAQVMIDADVSGVAFGRDPVDGSDCAVVAAAYGLGSGVVGGDCDADTYRVARDGAIVERRIGHKTLAHRRSTSIEGVDAIAVPDTDSDRPALSDEKIREVVAMLRSIEALFGEAQDVEWAISGNTLYVLQARPVTTPAGTIWDNSNIAESYGGLVSPLTFSFARHAYAGAYRQFMRVLGIDRETIAAHADALENMLGLINGRMYYNLLNWYRLLALVPGFRLNRRFMENMMGVSEALSPETVRELQREGKARDLVAVTRMLVALLYRYARLNYDIRAFHRRIADTLAMSPPLGELDVPGLLAEFSRLEDGLLTNWEAPLVNDFFAMTFYGVLRAITARWLDDDDGSLHNDLLCAAGGMVSAEPAQWVASIASLIREDDALITALAEADVEEAVIALRARPDGYALYLRYLQRFGDRCPNELKLESSTLHMNPLPLLRAIGSAAKAPAKTDAIEAAQSVRRAAEIRVARAMRGKPLRRLAYGFIVKHARARIRDRENLRLERTHVFARVREIMLELGQRLYGQEKLSNPRDIFLAELEELRSGDLREVTTRRERYAMYATLPAPPDRFTAIGATAPPQMKAASIEGDASKRAGIGCCPGSVRARVRVLKNATGPLQSGEILVAEHTDPGWVVLFPAAAGILVERGSVLSHAAIVSREMGIPSIVGIPGLTQWLRDGDVVEFDGRSGVVHRLRACSSP